MKLSMTQDKVWEFEKRIAHQYDYINHIILIILIILELSNVSSIVSCQSDITHDSIHSYLCLSSPPGILEDRGSCLKGFRLAMSRRAQLLGLMTISPQDKVVEFVRHWPQDRQQERWKYSLEGWKGSWANHKNSSTILCDDIFDCVIAFNIPTKIENS